MSKVHWLALVSVPGIGGVTARKLVERFGSVKAVFSVPADELESVPRLSAQMIERLQAISLDAFEQDILALADEGINVLTWDDDEYPANLRDVNDAPPVLFVCGELRPHDSDAVAIVGTREPTPLAATLAEYLAYELAERGLTIVSGLALGIDSAAHRGALRAANGRTLAVPGSGLRNIFPPENTSLAEEITQHGAVLSELWPNVSASGPSLMARDRIVSGLSRAVIVVEAREKSGTMDTVRRAQAHGRLLMAVPGSPATQMLLSQGVQRLEPQNVDMDELAGRIRSYTLGGENRPLDLI